jgi:hypothetical protein
VRVLVTGHRGHVGVPGAGFRGRGTRAHRPLQGHHRALLCAADSSATAPSLELAAWLAPSVPVTDPARYCAGPGTPSSTAQPL